MNIAFLTPEYPHPKTGVSGGIGTSIRALAMALVKLNHGVIILLYGQKQDGSFEDEGIKVECIKNIKVKGLSWWLTRKKLERIINSHYDEGTIDLVEAPDWTGITSFIKPKKYPVIIRMHGSDTYFCHLEKRPSKWINRFHERRAMSEADGLISVSRFTGELSLELFGLSRSFEVITNGVNLEQFHNPYSDVSSHIDEFNHDQKTQRSPNKKTILYFGTLIRKKGALELPHIFNQIQVVHPEAELILIGKDSGDVISSSKSTWGLMKPLFSKSAIKKVRYLGPVAHERIRENISRADVCVFPSFAEAFPLSWLEAMLMGKAIVASDIGWAKEMIEDGVHGFIVNPKNNAEFAHRVSQFLENKDLAQKMGKNAQERVKKEFSSHEIAKQSLAFYDKILSHGVL
jgi:glycosyltransferase involved in cell wall biosynthesis